MTLWYLVNNNPCCNLYHSLLLLFCIPVHWLLCACMKLGKKILSTLSWCLSLWYLVNNDPLIPSQLCQNQRNIIVDSLYFCYSWVRTNHSDSDPRVCSLQLPHFILALSCFQWVHLAAQNCQMTIPFTVYKCAVFHLTRWQRKAKSKYIDQEEIVPKVPAFAPGRIIHVNIEKRKHCPPRWDY